MHLPFVQIVYNIIYLKCKYFYLLTNSILLISLLSNWFRHLFFSFRILFPFIGLAVGSVNFRVFIPIYIYTFWKSLLHVLMNFIIFLLIWSDVIERRFESDFFIPKLFFLPLLIMRDMWKACQCFVLPTLKLCI